MAAQSNHPVEFHSGSTNDSASPDPFNTQPSALLAQLQGSEALALRQRDTTQLPQTKSSTVILPHRKPLAEASQSKINTPTKKRRNDGDGDTESSQKRVKLHGSFESEGTGGAASKTSSKKRTSDGDIDVESSKKRVKIQGSLESEGTEGAASKGSLKKSTNNDDIGEERSRFQVPFNFKVLERRASLLLNNTQMLKNMRSEEAISKIIEKIEEAVQTSVGVEVKHGALLTLMKIMADLSQHGFSSAKTVLQHGETPSNLTKAMISIAKGLSVDDRFAFITSKNGWKWERKLKIVMAYYKSFSSEPETDELLKLFISEGKKSFFISEEKKSERGIELDQIMSAWRDN